MSLSRTTIVLAAIERCRAAILDDGRVIQSGTLEDISACPHDCFVRGLVEELDGQRGHRA